MRSSNDSSWSYLLRYLFMRKSPLKLAHRPGGNRMRRFPWPFPHGSVVETPQAGFAIAPCCIVKGGCTAPEATLVKPVTQLLLEWREGDSSARDELFAVVYGELKQVARGQLRRERPNHT